MPSTKKPFDLDKYVMSQLKRLWHKSPQRAMALSLALRPYGKYECAECGLWFEKDQIEVDHRQPVFAVTGWDGFDASIHRLFCDHSGLQILCQATCHAAKSAAENAERRKYKKGKS